MPMALTKSDAFKCTEIFLPEQFAKKGGGGEESPKRSNIKEL